MNKDPLKAKETFIASLAEEMDMPIAEVEKGIEVAICCLELRRKISALFEEGAKSAASTAVADDLLPPHTLGIHVRDTIKMIDKVGE